MNIDAKIYNKILVKWIQRHIKELWVWYNVYEPWEHHPKEKSSVTKDCLLYNIITWIQNSESFSPFCLLESNQWIGQKEKKRERMYNKDN